MKTKKIVIAGGTGFIGQYLKKQFENLGYEILIIARKAPSIVWEDNVEIKAALENAEVLINLAGKSVDCRYNEKNKSEILNSRTESTKILGNAISQCKNPPKLWINSSTATIYRHAEDRGMTEGNGEIGEGFSVNVAKNWEKTFFDFDLNQTRKVALRIAIVLGKDGGAFSPLKNLVKFGLGGPQGNGNQMFSWLHIEDLFRIILFIQKRNELEGIFNCSSPYPISNRILMKTLREKMNIPFGLSSPKWLLEIGAILIKTETELILKSRWVLPERLLNLGFNFKFTEIDSAVRNILE
jgi:uncharacterized protein